MKTTLFGYVLTPAQRSARFRQRHGREYRKQATAYMRDWRKAKLAAKAAGGQA